MCKSDRHFIALRLHLEDQPRPAPFLAGCAAPGNPRARRGAIWLQGVDRRPVEESQPHDAVGVRLHIFRPPLRKTRPGGDEWSD